MTPLKVRNFVTRFFPRGGEHAHGSRQDGKGDCGMSEIIFGSCFLLKVETRPWLWDAEGVVVFEAPQQEVRSLGIWMRAQVRVEFGTF